MRQATHGGTRTLRNGSLMAALLWLLAACCSTPQTGTISQTQTGAVSAPATAQTERPASADPKVDTAATETPEADAAPEVAQESVHAPQAPQESPPSPGAAQEPPGTPAKPRAAEKATDDAASAPVRVAKVTPAPPPAAATATATESAVAKKAPAVANETPAADNGTQAATANVPDDAENSPSEALKPVPNGDTPPADKQQKEAPPTKSALDLDALEQRLRKTKAVGLFTKLEIKSEVEDLLDEVRAYHEANSNLSLAQLKEHFNLLVMKLLVLLEDGDPQLHRDLATARPALWTTLADPNEFSSIKGP